jgi:hypothetical protein
MANYSHHLKTGPSGIQMVIFQTQILFSNQMVKNQMTDYSKTKMEINFSTKLNLFYAIFMYTYNGLG